MYQNLLFAWIERDTKADLENYVLKPFIFSFAGAGVIIDVTREDIDDQIQDKSNYILQRKVTYEPVLKS